jgi:hypothetical protein
VIGQGHDVVVGKVLHERRHQRHRPHALAHQHQRVEQEELRLAGQRRVFLHRRIAVITVAGLAELQLIGHRHLLRGRAGGKDRKDGRQRERRRPEEAHHDATASNS